MIQLTDSANIVNADSTLSNIERVRERNNNKFVKKTVKFNPEGTCGPIWPEVISLF